MCQIVSSTMFYINHPLISVYAYVKEGLQRVAHTQAFIFTPSVIPFNIPNKFSHLTMVPRGLALIKKKQMTFLFPAGVPASSKTVI